MLKYLWKYPKFWAHKTVEPFSYDSWVRALYVAVVFLINRIVWFAQFRKRNTPHTITSIACKSIALKWIVINYFIYLYKIPSKSPHFQHCCVEQEISLHDLLLSNNSLYHICVWFVASVILTTAIIYCWFLWSLQNVASCSSNKIDSPQIIND